MSVKNNVFSELDPKSEKFNPLQSIFVICRKTLIFSSLTERDFSAIKLNKKIITCCLLLLFYSLIGSGCSIQNKQGYTTIRSFHPKKNISFNKKQSTISVITTGESFLGDFDTLHDIKQRALLIAQKKALLKAKGVFIRETSIVAEGKLINDEIYSQLDGKIEKFSVIDQKFDSEKRKYWIKIKAMVIVSPVKQNKIGLKAFLRKTELIPGEKNTIYYQTDQDCYIYIFCVASDHSVTLLFPNSIDQDNFIKKNVAYQFPKQNSPVQLIARKLPQDKNKIVQEEIRIIATKRKEPLLLPGFQQGLSNVYDINSTAGLNLLIKKLGYLDVHDWESITLVYDIK